MKRELLIITRQFVPDGLPQFVGDGVAVPPNTRGGRARSQLRKCSHEIGAVASPHAAETETATRSDPGRG